MVLELKQFLQNPVWHLSISALLSLNDSYVKVFEVLEIKLALILLWSPYSESGQPGKISVLKMFLYIVIK